VKTEALNKNKYFPRGEITEAKLQIRKVSWIRVPVKTLGLGVIICSVIFNDMYRKTRPMIFKDMYRKTRPMISYRATEIDKKCKRLSKFAAKHCGT
jgi:hypothetical protein